jgi:2-methylisocitrate lyase-like PEP mutase family enzyme
MEVVAPLPVDSILAIDPGDEHVGWALGVRGLGDVWGVKAGQWGRPEAVRAVRDALHLHHVDELVIEKFVLYPDRAAQQAFSPMLTSELIGKLKFLAELNDVPVEMQGAMIKKPTAAQLAARGIKRVGVGSHARDAELHLYYRLLRTQ